MFAAPASPFDDVLEDLRITGSVLLHETYAPPWAIDIPGEGELRQTLGLSRDVRLLPFHLVRRGAFDLELEGHPPARVDTNEVAICPGGAAHRMSYGAAAVPVSLEHILRTNQLSPPQCSPSDGTELVCGVFLLRAIPLNPLLTALPPVLKVKTAGSDANPLLARAADMLRLELADGRHGSFTASRLLEVFCAEAIQAYRQSGGDGRPGWLTALNDPRIGRAMTEVHGKPGEAWTVARLAEKAAMSPSRFAARFREVTGESVMSYVMAWRINTACRMLRETDFDLAGIAATIGYQDVAAFSRVFKALVGESPAKWRAHQRGARHR